MRVSLARQEFTRTLPHTRGHRASRVTMVVQIELQQLQILRTDLPMQKYVRKRLLMFSTQLLLRNVTARKSRIARCNP